MGIAGRGSGAITILRNSRTALKFIGNDGINQRNKHIDLTYHFVRNVVSREEIHRNINRPPKWWPIH